MNFHIDDPGHHDTTQFLKIFDNFDLTQHVRDRTHRSGHTLDVIITRASEADLVQQVRVIPPDVISDHAIIHCQLQVTRPPPKRKVIRYRRVKSIDIGKLSDDFRRAMPANFNHMDVSAMVDNYNSILLSLLDKHAPVKEKVVTERTNGLFGHNFAIQQAKREHRRLERRWRHDKNEINRQLYVQKCKQIVKLTTQQQSDYYNEKIKECASDQKALFSIINKLTRPQSKSAFPERDCNRDLAEEFSDYFAEKVGKIRDSIGSEEIPPPVPCSTAASNQLSRFSTLSTSEVQNIVSHAPSKTCSLDPVPTRLVKSCCPALVPYITVIINASQLLHNLHTI